jgi:hypothetical protein
MLLTLGMVVMKMVVMEAAIMAATLLILSLLGSWSSKSSDSDGLGSWISFNLAMIR